MILLLISHATSIYSFAHIWFFTFSGTRLLRGTASEIKVFLPADAGVSWGPITLPRTFATVLCTVSTAKSPGWFSVFLKGVVSKETVVLRRWGSSLQKFDFINGVDNVNWPPFRDSKS